ncbi:MAG: hypothetical protein FWE67_03540, partial [Planctomycetaceae bacterium]|nr:hypothetical protein [Planctomycetaceae bacterium]
FQLRCGLFDEAMETYSKITFRDRPNSSGRPETVDRVRFLQTLFVMSIARNKLDNAEKIIELVRPNVVKSFMLISLARAYQRAGDGEKALEIIDALIPPPVRVVLVSGLYKPDPTPETFPFIGYLALLDDLLHDEAGRKQNSKQVETLLDRYRAEIKKTANPQIRLERYSALISLLYWNDLRDSAMKIVEEIDSPHHAARVLLNIATDHETVADYRRQWLAEFYELDLQRFYAEYPERRLMEVYNSSYYYLDLAFAIKSAEGVEQQEAEKWERRRAPFEPDTAAMRMLLDKAAAVIEKETSPLNRASVLGAIGKMEYIYLEKENAKKRFNEALELLRSAKVEPGYSAAYQLARIFTELGEKDKALNAIKIDLFGNEPGKEIYANQKLSGNTESNLQLLEMLAQNGEAEFAAELFPRVYDVQHEYWRAGHVATIVVIALHHDSQNPKNPMLPKAQEQYQEYLRKLVRTVYQQQGELNKESALHNILLAWAAAENRIRSVQAQIAEKQASRSIADEYLTRRRGGYESPLFGEFELP